MLYKYFSLASDKSRESFEALVRNSKVWLSSFESFNDPFENMPVIKHDLDHKRIRERYRRLRSQNIEDIANPVDREAAVALKGTHISRINSVINEKYVREDLSPKTERDALDVFANHGVSCFSRDGGSPAMWAYYANNHMGAVVQLSSSPIQSSGQLVQEVTYLKNRPVIGLSRLVPEETTRPLHWEDVKHFIATKSFDWVHEKEVRIIVRDRRECYYNLSTNITRSVIVGCRATDETRRLVETVASKEDVFQARLCDSEYRILWDRLA